MPTHRTPRTADPYRDLAVIDARAPRFNQAAVGILSLAGVLAGWWWLFGLVAFQLTLGLWLGRRFCLPCLVYFELVQPRLGEGPLEDARPPRFANQIGRCVPGPGPSLARSAGRPLRRCWAGWSPPWPSSPPPPGSALGARSIGSALDCADSGPVPRCT